MKTGPDDRRGRSKMRFECLNAFCDRGIVEGDLTPAAIATWLVLFRHAQPDHTVTTSVDQIAASARICRRTALRALKELKAVQMVRTIRKGGIGRGCNVYLIRPYPPAK